MCRYTRIFVRTSVKNIKHILANRRLLLMRHMHANAISLAALYIHSNELGMISAQSSAPTQTYHYTHLHQQCYTT